jgi:hypothetical protein
MTVAAAYIVNVWMQVRPSGAVWTLKLTLTQPFSDFALPG